MKSPTVLNYEIRPCKFAERRMLLHSFSRIIGSIGQKYQYVGFGGLSFTDFKLFHKELNIDCMYSIESAYSQKKVEFNKPYSCIKILKGFSTLMLTKIDLSKPSIIWLDYDDTLNPSVFEDISIIMGRIPHGSIFVMSCNRQLSKKVNDKTIPLSKDELIEKFGDLVPFDLPENCCIESECPKTIRSMVEGFCLRAIKERKKSNEQVVFMPLYNFTYEEYRGARMFTYGGIVLNEDFDHTKLNVQEFDFVSTDSPYEIDIPNLTYKEASYLCQILNDSVKERELVDNNIISQTKLDQYKKIYKYMPNFYDVRL